MKDRIYTIMFYTIHDHEQFSISIQIVRLNYTFLLYLYPSLEIEAYE